ncbi:alpha/beta fold hydrolase [Pullulanibacillus sp. KACC 23026]|uniref:S9 family peptidase n=1 Tax=Pullulanibacillus sp. KACC 23026 TaxID=3028315 RepID=UPI0023AF2CC1|nr:alpha/beta fold hydrolase [Pullulanibacillus sp. KACC 23026]WEG13720.1 alpha/beta fold hydrolase [Pullulanibacillus sp. KACC 23026]
MGTLKRKGKAYSVESFFKSESLFGGSFSHEGDRLLYTSDRTGVYNAYSISTSGGEPAAKTESTKDTIQALSYFPHDDRFLFMKDLGGNELLHIYVGEEDGTTKELTLGDTARAEFYGWTHEGDAFIYGYNGRDPRYMDVYLMSTTSYEATCLFENTEGYQFHALSADQKQLALSKVTSANDTNMYVYDLETQALTHLSDHEGDAHFLPQMFDRTGGSLYYLTDLDDEFLQLKKIDLTTGHSSLVLAEPWDITSAAFSHAYRYMKYIVNEDGTYTTKVLDQATGERLEIKGFSQRALTQLTISRSEAMLCFYSNTSTMTPNLFVYHIKSERLIQLTNTLSPDLDSTDLVEVEVVRFPASDGLMIPAILYKPHLNEVEKVPALVWVHGGPGGQSLAHYNVLMQYLANQGYAVLAVNNRGSSGYGKSFFKAADHQHGEIDLADCLSGRDYLQTLDYIDAEKIGIIGGSYGGYMVGAALAFQPDAFKVGVNIFGVMNWERTLKSIPAWWESGREALYRKIGNPYTEVDYIRSISPLFHADQITKPLIVLQGANDPRVLKVESDEIVEAVKKNGVPVDYIVFDDEGHGFTKKANQIKGYQAIVDFLNCHLAA